jgi:hypothetical protein
MFGFLQQSIIPSMIVPIMKRIVMYWRVTMVLCFGYTVEAELFPPHCFQACKEFVLMVYRSDSVWNIQIFKLVDNQPKELM